MTAAMPPNEIDSMRKVAQTLVDAENAWRTDETQTKWAAVERARQALESYIDAAELLRLLARLAEAEELLRELEFSRTTRNGYACPSCGGLRRGGEDFSSGPDEGHNYGCKLRAHLGARGK